MNKEQKAKAGHYEIHGETIAKFEFFDNGFNPYSRYLDVDKIDLILRKRIDDHIRYMEVQVKYGRLYLCGNRWEKELFDFTSWKFFKLEEFKNSRSNFYIAYVLVNPTGYQGDIFIFPGKVFAELINNAIMVNTKKGKQATVFIAHSPKNNRWYLWKKRNFDELNEENTIDLTDYRRNFSLFDSVQ